MKQTPIIDDSMQKWADGSKSLVTPVVIGCAVKKGCQMPTLSYCPNYPYAKDVGITDNGQVYE